MTRAAGYIRVSTDLQAQAGMSLGDQRRLIEEHAAEQSWQLVRIYEDAGISGSLEDRPQLLALREAVAAGELDAVLIWDMDRLARNLRLALALADEFAAANVRVYELGKRSWVEVESPEDELNFTIGGAVAQYQRRQIGRNVSRSMPGRVGAGKHLGATPFGYSKEPGSPPTPVPEQSVIVRRIFEEFAAGESTNTIQRRLNAEGIKPKRGKRWATGTIHRMLRNRVYVGEVRYRDEWHPGQHDSIIDPDLFERAQERLGRIAVSAPRGRRAKERHLLQGKLFCGHCGERMSPRGNVYRCVRRWTQGTEACDQTPIPRAAVDAAVFNYFAAVGLDREATKAQLESALNWQLTQVQTLRRDAEREAREAEAAYERVRHDYQRGAIETDDWAEQRPQLTEEREAASANVERLRARELELEAEQPWLDAEGALLERLEALRAAFQGAAPSGPVPGGAVRTAPQTEAARDALDQLFESFHVHRTDRPWVPGEQAAAAAAQREPRREDGIESLAAGEWEVIAIPRPEVLADLGADYRPVLRRVPLGSAENNGAQVSL